MSDFWLEFVKLNWVRFWSICTYKIESFCKTKNTGVLHVVMVRNLELIEKWTKPFFGKFELGFFQPLLLRWEDIWADWRDVKPLIQCAKIKHRFSPLLIMYCLVTFWTLVNLEMKFDCWLLQSGRLDFSAEYGDPAAWRSLIRVSIISHVVTLTFDFECHLIFICLSKFLCLPALLTYYS